MYEQVATADTFFLSNTQWIPQQFSPNRQSSRGSLVFPGDRRHLLPKKRHHHFLQNERKELRVTSNKIIGRKTIALPQTLPNSLMASHC